MIAGGVLAALAMNTFVFPKHCRVNKLKRPQSPIHHHPSGAILAKCEPYSRLVESAVPDAQQVLFMSYLMGSSDRG